MRLRRKRKVWELSQAAWGGHQVLMHLTAGWEPFAITEEETVLGTQWIVWFRRQVDEDDYPR